MCSMSQARTHQTHPPLHQSTKSQAQTHPKNAPAFLLLPSFAPKTSLFFAHPWPTGPLRMTRGASRPRTAGSAGSPPRPASPRGRERREFGTRALSWNSPKQFLGESSDFFRNPRPKIELEIQSPKTWGNLRAILDRGWVWLNIGHHLLLYLRIPWVQLPHAPGANEPKRPEQYPSPQERVFTQKAC